MGNLRTFQHQKPQSSAVSSSLSNSSVPRALPTASAHTPLEQLEHAHHYRYSFADIPLFAQVQRKHASSSPLHEGDKLQGRIQATRSGGHALDEHTRLHLEHGLHTNLSGLHVHTNAEADHLARSLNAAAFTTGPDIYFRSGMYNPSSSQGLHLLAHEATHVVQQATGQVTGTTIMGDVSVSDPNDRFEQAAEASAARIAARPYHPYTNAKQQQQHQEHPDRIAGITNHAGVQRTIVQRTLLLNDDADGAINEFLIFLNATFGGKYVATVADVQDRGRNVSELIINTGTIPNKNLGREIDTFYGVIYKLVFAEENTRITLTKGNPGVPVANFDYKAIDIQDVLAFGGPGIKGPTTLSVLAHELAEQYYHQVGGDEYEAAHQTGLHIEGSVAGAIRKGTYVQVNTTRRAELFFYIYPGQVVLVRVFFAGGKVEMVERHDVTTEVEDYLTQHQAYNANRSIQENLYPLNDQAINAIIARLIRDPKLNR